MDIGDWKPWVDLFEGFWDRSKIWKVVYLRPGKDRLAAAAAASVAKWHPVRGVDAGCGPCGLCMYQSIKIVDADNRCGKCQAVHLCGDIGTNVFREWELATDGSRKKESKAIEMYQGLLKIYRDVSNHTERSV